MGSLDDLVADEWIQLGQQGTVNAYVINSAVAWGESRDQIPRLSVFHAAVVADAEDQSAETLERRKLRKLPIIILSEEALPHGDGKPGAQTLLPGFEPVIKGRREE